MLIGILILAVIATLAVLSHRRSRLESKVLKHVPVSDWLTVFIIPILIYIGWMFIIRSIVARSAAEIIPLDDIDIIILTILFMVYGFVGNAIHFTGKILWRYLPRRNTMAYKVNEMFHGKFSHYLIDINGSFILFMLAVMEINHPLVFPLPVMLEYLVISAGFMLGLAVRKYIFFTDEWFGGYNKPIFFLSVSLMFLLVLIFRTFTMNLSLYPVCMFILSYLFSFTSSFIVRQVMIFTRLNQKRRMRFVTKIFSV